MQTTTAPKAGNAPDLLQGILSVQVRNEDKITEQDRVYCQTQQNLLYKTLDQIDRWYAVFKEEAEQYQAERKFHYEENGKVSMRDFYTYHNDREDYSHNEFKPFDLINDLVDKNRNANANFANRIISYFNRTYKVSVPEYKIDEKTLPMGFRPVYDTYVDVVIEHLGGKSFPGNGRGRTARTPEQSCQTGILEQSQDGVEEGQDNLSRNHPFRRFFHAIQPKEQNLLQLRRRTGNPVCRHCLRCG